MKTQTTDKEKNRNHISVTGKGLQQTAADADETITNLKRFSAGQ